MLVALAWASLALAAWLVLWLPDRRFRPRLSETLANGFASAWQDLLYLAVALSVATVCWLLVRGSKARRAIVAVFGIVALLASWLVVANTLSMRWAGFPFSIQWLSYLAPANFYSTSAALWNFRITRFEVALMTAAIVVPAILVLFRRSLSTLVARFAKPVLALLGLLGAASSVALASDRTQVRSNSPIALLGWEVGQVASEAFGAGAKGVADPAWAALPPEDAIAKPAANVNFAVIVLDSVPFDYLADDRYAELTPTIARLRREGLYFENAYAPFPASTRSLVSFVTGTYPTLSRILESRASDAAAMPSIGREFERAGYRTSFIMSGDLAHNQTKAFLDRGGFGLTLGNRGMTCPDAGPDWMARYAHLGDDCAVDYALRALPTEGEPFLQVLWLTDTHHPYLHREKRTTAGRNAEETDFLNALASTDDAVARYLSGLEERGIAENTIIALMSDHGESFGERGIFLHHASVYDEQVRVPLLWHGPGIPSGERRAMPVSLVDILPSLIDLADLETETPIQGRSVFADNPARDIFFLALRGDNQVGLRRGNTKIIQNIRSGEVVAYDLEADPGETQPRPLAGEEADKMAARLAGWSAYRAGLYAD